MVKGNNSTPCIIVIVQEGKNTGVMINQNGIFFLIDRSIDRLRQGYKAAEADPQHALGSQAVARALADLEPCTHTARARWRSVTSGRRAATRARLA